MILNHTKQFIFIHTPRTGGFSAYAMFKTHGMLTGSRTPNHKPRNAFKYPDYFSFGFLRNHWERLYSSYQLLNRKWKNTKKSHFEFASKSFKHFLLEDNVPNLKRPGMYFVKGCTFIGKFENFDNDWKYIFNQLSVDNINIIHQHKSSKSSKNNYKHHYDNEMIDFISEHSKDDIEYFNYTFEK